MGTTMTNKMIWVLFGLAVGVAFAACGGSSLGPGPLPEARSTVEISGETVRLEASAWRDFMPGPGPRETDLTLSLTLVAERPDAVDSQIQGFGRVWVEHGREVWSRKVDEVPKQARRNEVLIGRADGGPRWPTGDTVTVVVSVRTAGQGIVRLKAEDVVIQRVS